jgi:hypothetical protein
MIAAVCEDTNGGTGAPQFECPCARVFTASCDPLNDNFGKLSHLREANGLTCTSFYMKILIHIDKRRIHSSRLCLHKRRDCNTAA